MVFHGFFVFLCQIYGVMKKFVFLLVLSSLFLSSCRYEEEPGISFLEPEYRIVGDWVLDHVYLNGVLVTESDFLANRPGNYYLIYYDGVLQVNTFYNNTIRYSNYGYWHFENNAKNLVLEFNLINHKYYYVARIKRLTKYELFYEYDDEYGNHWRLEMACINRRN